MERDIRAKVRLTGRPPGLVIHSSELADELNDFSVEIGKLVDQARGRRKLTAEQRDRLDQLRWRGALGELYCADGKNVVMPANNLLRAVVTAARELNLGSKIEDRGALSFEAAEIPLDIPGWHGEEPVIALYANPRHRLRIPVNPNPTARTKVLLPVMRPVFPEWSGAVMVRVLPELLDWDKFTRVMELAGNVGVGNARKIGYGRFDVSVERA